MSNVLEFPTPPPTPAATAAELRSFLLSGSSAFTLESHVTGRVFAFSVSREGLPLVSLIAHGETEPIGVLTPGGIRLRYGVRSDELAVMAVVYAWRHLCHGVLPPLTTLTAMTPGRQVHGPAAMRSAS